MQTLHLQMKLIGGGGDGFAESWPAGFRIYKLDMKI